MKKPFLLFFVFLTCIPLAFSAFTTTLNDPQDADILYTLDNTMTINITTNTNTTTSCNATWTNRAGVTTFIGTNNTVNQTTYLIDWDISSLYNVYGVTVTASCTNGTVDTDSASGIFFRTYAVSEIDDVAVDGIASWLVGIKDLVVILALPLIILAISSVVGIFYFKHK